VKRKPRQVIIRIDERLIHAQVLIGWIAVLGLKTLVLASRRVTEDAENRELFSLIVPAHLEFLVMPEEDAAVFVSGYSGKADKCMVVLESLADAVRFLDAGSELGLSAIHIGGIYHRDDRKKYRTALFLSDAEEKHIADIEAKGIEVTFMPLPGAKPLKMKELLSRA